MPRLRDGKIGDFTRGFDTWLHAKQMLLLSAAWIVLLCASLSMVFAVIAVIGFSDQCTKSQALSYVQAKFGVLVKPFSSVEVLDCSDGTSHSMPARIVAESREVKSGFYQLARNAIGFFVAGMVMFSPLAWLIARRATKRGERLIQDKYLRGAQLRSQDELAEEIRAKHGTSDILIGDLPLPIGFAKKHTLVTGTTGAGKSTLLVHLLRSIRARGDRAVVYDKKGEFVSMFYRDGIDHLLYPADARSHHWHPWAEMAGPFDADWIAEAMVPEQQSQGGGDNRFFVAAARNVLASAMQTLYLDGHHDLETLVRATAWNDGELLQELCAGTSAAGYFNQDNERTLESIKSTLLDAARPLRLLHSSPGRGAFSIRSWVADEDDSWLFLPVRESDIEVQTPLISVWVQAVAKGLMARGVDEDRILWLILDELPSLKKIPALSVLMAEGRGFGAAVVIGIQELNQLEESFGRHTAKTLLGLCSTQFHFRLNNQETADWVSKVLGDVEQTEVDEDLQYSADDIRDGVRISAKRQSRKIVLPSEIMDLPDLSAYAKIWGATAKARIDVPFLRLPTAAEPFVAGDAQQSVGMRLTLESRRVTAALTGASAVSAGAEQTLVEEQASEDFLVDLAWLKRDGEQGGSAP